jgi:hypothetical protein
LPLPAGSLATPRLQRLTSGWQITFSIALNAKDGYRLTRPGSYRVLFLGSALGLPDSNPITIRITP